MLREAPLHRQRRSRLQEPSCSSESSRPVRPSPPCWGGYVSPRLVLGSSSPYRRALLERLGVPFTVRSPDIDEAPREGESPRATAQRLAEAKALAVAALEADCVVIGSDQVAASGHLRLDKPGEPERAVAQLLAVRGRAVSFFTAVHVVEGGSGRTLGMHCDETRVTLRADLTEAMLRHYVALDQPLDCAGSARVEALGIALLERCDSHDPTALIGLPMIVLSRILRECGIDPLQAPPQAAPQAAPNRV
ncbi:MAG: septum formation protein Maf [Rhodocyclaceae bacterium]|nr:septum formation protein Maf [Rhodocyclaceae bacterium]